MTCTTESRSCGDLSCPHCYWSDAELAKVKGYHINVIHKGDYGESSKIMEEVLELQDAEEQGARIMVLCELSDIIGAIDGYLAKHYPDTTIADLQTMAGLTRRAFRNGVRK